MLRAYGKTDTGRERQNNQDSFVTQQLGEDALLAVVCDGMGGENGGNIASRNAVNIISQHVSSNYQAGFGENSIRNMMLSAVSVANALVYQMAQRDPALAGMGTTLLLGVVKGMNIHLLHAGDSRAYLLDAKAITRITKDHSVVQLLIESGELTEVEARVHPKKHFITRALGVKAELDAAYSEWLLPPGQALLLCTDGLSNHLEEEAMWRTVWQSQPEQAPQALVDAANAQGGKDNITAVLVYNRIL